MKMYRMVVGKANPGERRDVTKKPSGVNARRASF